MLPEPALFLVQSLPRPCWLESPPSFVTKGVASAGRVWGRAGVDRGPRSRRPVQDSLHCRPAPLSCTLSAQARIRERLGHPGRSVPSCPQALLKALLALAVFFTAVTAISIGAYRFQSYDFTETFCDSAPSWGPSEPPSAPSPEEFSRLPLCLLKTDMQRASGPGRGRQQVAEPR